MGEHFQVIAGAARTTHYLYEPGSFVPLAQAVRRKAITLPVQPAYAEDYDLDEDPLWTQAIEPQAFDAIAWYQCDHLGTPQELTDEAGEIAWSVQYKAWGAAQEVITDAARKAGIHNPLRFQGQYYDHETGLHYNRHRYYDPVSGRFVSKDPIGLAGGLNIYQYAPNPAGWVDPLGLARISPGTKRKVAAENTEFHGAPTCECCLTQVVPGQKSMKGVIPPQTERQFDHVIADASGGANTVENTQVLCRKCNRGFSNIPKPNFKELNRLNGGGCE